MDTAFVRLPDAELEIMRILWAQRTPMTSRQILTALEGKKSWGLTTVLNFLTRLVQRGYVGSEKAGRSHLFMAVIDRETYRRQAVLLLLDQLFDGSAEELIHSLYADKVPGASAPRDIEKDAQSSRPNGDMPSWLL